MAPWIRLGYGSLSAIPICDGKSTYLSTRQETNSEEVRNGRQYMHMQQHNDLRSHAGSVRPTHSVWTDPAIRTDPVRKNWSLRQAL